MSLFDRQNLAEIQSPLYPGERLVACFNPLLAEERRRKRDELLAAWEEQLGRIEKEVRRRTKITMEAGEIGKKVGRAINRWEMGKHLVVDIADGRLEWHRDDAKKEAEAALDGVYIIRTNQQEETLPAPEAVRQYKNLARVEEVFRTMKGTDVLIRPIRHRLPARVRAHVFICMPAYYVVWHMKHALAPMLSHHQSIDQERRSRDPVAKATPTVQAARKKQTKTDAEGNALHSFRSLLDMLKPRCRNQCVTKTTTVPIRTTQHTLPSKTQQRAFGLLGLKIV